MNKTNINRSQHQIVGFNYLRAAACIAIIVLHTTYACAVHYQNVLALSSLSATTAVTHCMMWAVPCFVMVTGALLLNPDHEVTLKKIYGKYLKRVFVALVVFVLVYRVFDMAISPEGVTARGFLLGFVQIVKGTSWKPLWYLYMLIGLYMLLPVWRRVVQGCTKIELKYFLGIYFIFLSILPLFSAFGFTINFTIHIASIYPFYLFLGYALKQGMFKMKKSTGLVAGIIGIILVVVLTDIRWTQNAAAFEAFWSYSSPIIIILSAAVFNGFMNIAHQAPKAGHRLLMALDEASFGIYLIHIIFVKLFVEVVKFDPYAHGILGFIGLILAILVLSFICAEIIVQIKKAVKRARQN
jgi:surface polysaccharide O-acyltransferase-like enzyme